jgi:hypothetical protein
MSMWPFHLAEAFLAALLKCCRCRRDRKHPGIRRQNRAELFVLFVLRVLIVGRIGGYVLASVTLSASGIGP